MRRCERKGVSGRGAQEDEDARLFPFELRAEALRLRIQPSGVLPRRPFAAQALALFLPFAEAPDELPQSARRELFEKIRAAALLMKAGEHALFERLFARFGTRRELLFTLLDAGSDVLAPALCQQKVLTFVKICVRKRAHDVGELALEAVADRRRDLMLGLLDEREDGGVVAVAAVERRDVLPPCGEHLFELRVLLQPERTQRHARIVGQIAEIALRKTAFEPIPAFGGKNILQKFRLHGQLRRLPVGVEETVARAEQHEGLLEAVLPHADARAPLRAQIVGQQPALVLVVRGELFQAARVEQIAAGIARPHGADDAFLLPLRHNVQGGERRGQERHVGIAHRERERGDGVF